MRLLLCGCALLGAALAGCSALPSPGPTASAVLKETTAPTEARYSIAPIDESVANVLKGRAPTPRSPVSAAIAADRPIPGSASATRCR